MSTLPALVLKAFGRDRMFRGMMTRGDVRGLTRWIEDFRREWPQALHDAGRFAQFAVATLDQPAADQSSAFFEENQRDIARAYLLYQEYRAIGRHRLALPAPSESA